MKKNKIIKRERFIMKIEFTKNLSNVTKKVIADFNAMSDLEFRAKYQVSKRRYLKRVLKYGDPYMNAPLAKIGKFLNKVMRIS